METSWKHCVSLVTAACSLPSSLSPHLSPSRQYFVLPGSSWTQWVTGQAQVKRNPPNGQYGSVTLTLMLMTWLCTNTSLLILQVLRQQKLCVTRQQDILEVSWYKLCSDGHFYQLFGWCNISAVTVMVRTYQFTKLIAKLARALIIQLYLLLFYQFNAIYYIH